ncbi:carbohydrate ABC transporter substrate-binding protein, CUT1 family [Actinomyces ruminicola]|uniref:Carbohydrate ABC transporter substrate-binding protein, CUT1 family n=1 Tax=Actinomyces ruminicola TaxID=332524 RepID=A0A1H0BE80_9ACTO|nr:extracellular solute-binding protein [Actinomyces ruminicola]SDN43928.1 carbohydrate ABC transporter substrate-binding protein, CUT1 family [Actinomyces ruminicola]
MNTCPRVPALSRRTVLRSLAAATAVAAAGGTLAACGGSGSGGSNGLRILVLKHALTKPMAQMAWVKQLEDVAGMPITWEEVSADWDQKKSTMLAAGDVPDLIVGTGAISDSDLATYGTLFEDLSDDLDAIPNVKEMLAAKPELMALATQNSGAIYAVPGYKRFWPPTVQHQYINRQWLDALGLDMPTTWDELYDVLLAFKEGDPTGTGAKVIPMDWSPVGTTGFGYFQSVLLLGSTGLPLSSGGGQGYFLQDGKVSNFLIDERYRDVMVFLHKCYAAGLISAEVLTQDYSAYQSAARGPGDGVATVGFTWGWTRSDRFGPEIYEQYEAMPVLAQKAGQAAPVVWSYDGFGENFPANQIVVSAATPNKEAALKALNAFYDQEMSLQVLFGDIGPNIEKVDETTYKVLPAEDGTDPSTWKWTSTLADNGPMWIRDDITVELPTDLQEAIDESVPLQPAIDNMDLDQDVYPAQFIKMSAEDINAMALVDTTMLNTTQTKFADWITNGGVEEQWDDYLATVKASGLEDNIAKMQQYYDDYMASKQ